LFSEEEEMKRYFAGFLSGLVLGATVLVIAQETFYKGKVVFVKVPEENLRTKPGGEKIGALVKGTAMQVLATQGKWLQVATVGYIWSESVTGNESAFKGEPFRAAMILVKTQAEADAILQELKAGADFQQLATKKSISATGAKGGDLGDAYPGDFSTEFEQAILALKAGEISPVVKTENGYHIFKRLK
jgi:hypothetical protein